MRLRAPALALLVCAVVGIGCAVMGSAYWVPYLYHPEATIAQHQLALQTIAYCGLNFVVCLVVAAGAVGMFRRRPYWLAQTGAWASVVPLCGPCYLLAIPFGVWALVVLYNRDVAATFGREGK